MKQKKETATFHIFLIKKSKNVQVYKESSNVISTFCAPIFSFSANKEAQNRFNEVILTFTMLVELVC